MFQAIFLAKSRKAGHHPNTFRL
jgi:hypothetical protein